MGIRLGDGRRDYYGYGESSIVGYPRELELKVDPDSLSGGSMYCGQGLMESHMDSSPSSQSSGGGGTQNRNRKNKEEKICGVCGDKALGFNFDAISCESCKAFFRRNAPKGLGYFKCPYDEKCKMDLSNRRFCKRCRLKKCFEIGMRKEYILSEEEKAQKRQKIEDNRFLRRMCGAATSSSSNPSTSKSTSHHLHHNNHHHHQTLHPPPPPPPQSHTPQISQMAPQRSPSTMEHEVRPRVDYDHCSVGIVAGAVGGMPYIPACPPQPMIPILSHTTPLSAADNNAIYELHVAYSNSLEVSIERDVSRHEANFSDLVNIAELSVRRVIAMAKQVPAFKDLPQVEQIHLLKGGSIELLILRSVITFDKEKQHFLDPFDHEETKAMKLEQLERAENGTGLFEDHMRFVRSLAFDLCADNTVLILLLVISLFSPDRDNLEYQSLVAAEQERYSALLKNYLESIYPVPTARSLFPRLLMKLTDIRNLNEEHSQVLLKVNPEGIQPLMKEVLDLSC